MRELHEETGYGAPLLLLPALDIEHAEGTAHMFVGAVPREFDPKINWEHVMAIWVDPRTLDPTQLHWTARVFFAWPGALPLLAAARAAVSAVPEAIARRSGRRR